MTTVALPHFLVNLLPCDTLLLASPTRTVIASIESGEVLYTETHGHPSLAPRCSAVLFLGERGEGSSSQSTLNGSCLLALLGDDKVLRVFKVSGLERSETVQMDKRWSTSLPKRGVKMVWEEGNSGSEARLVVGDRHGDVRSFAVSLDNQKAEERDVKRRKVEEADKGGEELDEDIDSTNPPHLGHVSMLTDFVLTSFTSPSRQTPAPYIISSDRDEHIRISRWGSRRAGHLALRYLLGSCDAVGGLCVVEHDHLDVLRAAVGSGAARSMCQSPLLLSTESSRLRVWSLHKDEEASSRQDCLLVVDLFDAVSPYLKVDVKREQQRERMFAKGKADRNSGKEIDVKGEAGEVQVSGGSIVMLSLSAMSVLGEVYVTFTVDGASALFTVTLSKLLSAPSEEACSHVQALDFSLPLLDRVHQVKEKSQLLWLTCDVREGVMLDDLQGNGLRMAEWNDEHGRWEERVSGPALLARQDELQSRGPAPLAHSLLLYDALALYPKQEADVSSLRTANAAPNGLIRGGLAGFERTGLAKRVSAANKSNSERATGKKEKARTEMLQRIGAALGEGEMGNGPG